MMTQSKQSQIQNRLLLALVIKITFLRLRLVLKYPIFHLFTCQVVIGQFNKPITFKVFFN